MPRFFCEERKKNYRDVQLRKSEVRLEQSLPTSSGERTAVVLLASRERVGGGKNVYSCDDVSENRN